MGEAGSLGRRLPGEGARVQSRFPALKRRGEVFIAVGTSGVVYPAAGYGQLAQRRGARTLEINPIPSGADWFDDVLAQSADQALPALVSAWLS